MRLLLTDQKVKAYEKNSSYTLKKIPIEKYFLLN